MDTSLVKKIDAVFEGGGVKGSAIVGAVAVAEALGYQFENMAGTSAGAIAAALLSAGYNAAELKNILENIDYNRLKDADLIGAIPLIGSGLNLLSYEGLYKGDYFLHWLRTLLLAKHIRTFKDLVMPAYANEPRYRYKLQVIASDITRGKMLVLPGDIADHGVNPDDLEVALAVRMSMAIPYFFRPVIVCNAKHQPSYVVDGGVLSNYPVWLLDDGTPQPPWPTIGFKLVDPNESKPHTINNPINLFRALFETMLEAHDARYIQDSDFVRTIPIPTLEIQTTDFTITNASKEALFQAGSTAATDFFAHWDFAEYKKRYRAAAPPPRTKRLWPN